MVKRPRGRPRKPDIEKTKNVTVGADVLALLHKVQAAAEAKLGFKPTLSQTVRMLAISYLKE